MPKTHNQRIGTWGEAVAAGYLERKGYRIVARNARTPYGEIDLIARTEGGAWVFVEVKTRTGGGFGNPEEAVDARKLAHLTAAAQAYLLERGDDVDAWRIDAVAITGKPGAKVADVGIEHFEDIAG